MKAVFIVYNQALTERVSELLDKTNARGFTQWQDVKGRGSHTGEPHMGTHTWPAMNTAVLCMTDPATAKKLVEGVKKINEKASIQGIRAFLWDAEEGV
ncbi:MAG: PG0541 family transporter-associated protein [Bacteroidota bacterium]